MFTWNNIVITRDDAPPQVRPGSRAWIVGMSEASERSGDYLREFPSGRVYTIEFEDGSDAQALESWLIADD